MTQQQVIALIQQWIVANGNEEITADVLRPILEAMVNQPNDLIGDLNDLTTTNKDSVVDAINEVNNLSNGGITIHYGSDTPFITPPVSFELGDFYAQLDGSSVLGFWQYNGNEWVEISQDSAKPLFDYEDINEMLANQASQTIQKIYVVEDASGDSNITFESGETKLQAFYRYNGVETGSIDDYTLISAPYGNVDLKNDVNNLFILSPYPRQEISEGQTINIQVEAKNALYVQVLYKNPNTDWIVSGIATKVNGLFEIDLVANNPITAIKAVAVYPDNSTQESIRRIYSTAILDTFIDVDNTLLSSHIPDENSGNPWEIISGNWKIVNNKLSIDNADNGKYFVVQDVSSPNAIIRFSISQAGSYNHLVILRYVDSDNYYEVRINLVGLLEVFSVVGGNRTIIGNSSFVFSYGKVIEIQLIDDILNIVNPDYQVLNPPIPMELHKESTKHGFARPGANSDYYYDSYQAIPIEVAPTEDYISYLAEKSSEAVIVKNTFPGLDDEGVNAPSFFRIGDVNYMIFSVRTEATFDFDGISFATSTDDDPNNWTRYNGLILSSGTEFIGDSCGYFDGETLHIIYSGANDGIIYYANGSDILNLTKQGVLFDWTAQGIYLRHPNILRHDNKFYLYLDSRIDDPAGKYGDVWCGSGFEITSIDNFKNVLSTPGLSSDITDITSPSVRFNKETGYFEMLYGGFAGGTGDYIHDTLLAVCLTPDGEFVRISSEAIIPRGGTGDYDYIHSNPSWFLDYPYAYYNVKAQGSPGQDGFGYAELTQVHGASGTFTTVDGKTVTVTNGLVTSIVLNE